MRVSVAPHLVGCCLHWCMRRAYRINHNAHFITLLSANRLKQVHCMAFIVSCLILLCSVVSLAICYVYLCQWLSIITRSTYLFYSSIITTMGY